MGFVAPRVDERPLHANHQSFISKHVVRRWTLPRKYRGDSKPLPILSVTRKATLFTTRTATATVIRPVNSQISRCPALFPFAIARKLCRHWHECVHPRFLPTSSFSRFPPETLAATIPRRTSSSQRCPKSDSRPVRLTGLLIYPLIQRTYGSVLILPIRTSHSMSPSAGECDYIKAGVFTHPRPIAAISVSQFFCSAANRSQVLSAGCQTSA